MNYRLTVLAVLSSALLAGMVTANEPPPVPEGGIAWLHQTPCTDAETGQKGTCHIGRDKEGTFYVSFWVKRQLVTIRKRTPTGYETLWRRLPGELM